MGFFRRSQNNKKNKGGKKRVGDERRKELTGIPARTFSKGEIAERERRDVSQRSQTDRRRGWHDYQFLVRAHGIRQHVAFIDAISSAAIQYQEEGWEFGEGWGEFNIDSSSEQQISCNNLTPNETKSGDTVIVSFVTEPPTHHRFPSYVYNNRFIEATDGAIILVQPSISVSGLDHVFRDIKNCYEGVKLATYNAEAHYNAEALAAEDRDVLERSSKELEIIRSQTHHPVALVLCTSPVEHSTGYDGGPFDEYLEGLRRVCSKFMKSYGNHNHIRFYEVSDLRDTKATTQIVTQIISDVENKFGIPHSKVPIARSVVDGDGDGATGEAITHNDISLENRPKKFDTLDKLEKPVSKLPSDATPKTLKSVPLATATTTKSADVITQDSLSMSSWRRLVRMFSSSA